MSATNKALASIDLKHCNVICFAKWLGRAGLATLQKIDGTVSTRATKVPKGSCVRGEEVSRVLRVLSAWCERCLGVDQTAGRAAASRMRACSVSLCLAGRSPSSGLFSA